MGECEGECTRVERRGYMLTETGVFEDLDNYVREPTDGGVVATLAHKNLGKNDVEITMEAQQLKLKNEGGMARGCEMSFVRRSPSRMFSDMV
jgi:hypothetical protein